MGSSSSVFSGGHGLTIEMCVGLVMPLYYTTDPVEEEDITRGRISWNLIVDDTSPEFLLKKGTPECSDISALSWFFTIFYNRLFDVHPSCRPLFKNNIQTQGKALAKIITFLLHPHNDPQKLQDNLVDLAIRHVTIYHVKAHEYGILGEVLLYSICKVVGISAFDADTLTSWIRIYSMVITVIVPFHVKAELAQLKSHEVHEEDSRSSIMF